MAVTIHQTRISTPRFSTVGPCGPEAATGPAPPTCTWPAAGCDGEWPTLEARRRAEAPRTGEIVLEKGEGAEVLLFDLA